ncbi:hypothetical protein AAY473_025000 [Plecturocebus cupreus]
MVAVDSSPDVLAPEPALQLRGETGFHYIGQAGLELLTSSDLPTCAFQCIGITGASLYKRKIKSKLLRQANKVIPALDTTCSTHLVPSSISAPSAGLLHRLFSHNMPDSSYLCTCCLPPPEMLFPHHRFLMKVAMLLEANYPCYLLNMAPPMSPSPSLSMTNHSHNALGFLGYGWIPWHSGGSSMVTYSQISSITFFLLALGQSLSIAEKKAKCHLAICWVILEQVLLGLPVPTQAEESSGQWADAPTPRNA